MSDDGQNKGESTNEVECSPSTTPLNTTSITLPSQIKVPNIQETREINITEESCKNLSQENQSSYSDKSNHDQENETKVPTIPNNTMNIENTAKTDDNANIIFQLTLWDPTYILSA